MNPLSNRSLTIITKNFSEEGNITEHVAYYPMVGANAMSNFRSPDAFVLLLFETAKGVHSIDGKEFKEGDRQVHISFPQQLHSWDTQACIGHKLILSKYMVEKYLFGTGFPEFIVNRFPVLTLEQESFSTILKEVKRIAAELLNPDVEWGNIILRMRIVAILIGRSLQVKAKNYRPKSYYMKRFLELLEDDFYSHRQVELYAKSLSISTSYLNVLSKKEFGIPVKSMIDQKTILEAKRLLLEENLSIKEVGTLLGFRDMAHFSKFIKSGAGFSPQEFRETFRYTP